MNMRPAWVTLVAAALVTGCADPAAIADLPPIETASRAADACLNVDVDVAAPLGLWAFNGVPVPGGAPSPATLAGIDGYLASILLLDELVTHGRSETVHWSLQHVFIVGEPATLDLGGGFVIPAITLAEYEHWFITADRAVCAAAGSDPLVCRVNDRMPVVDGAGAFTNARGFMHNHGVITITDPLTGAGHGDFHARGRICGDGVRGLTG